LLIGVALVSSLVGLAAGAFTWPLLTALPSRVLLLRTIYCKPAVVRVQGALLNRRRWRIFCCAWANGRFPYGRRGSVGRADWEWCSRR
jgi:hypothetical protein